MYLFIRVDFAYWSYRTLLGRVRLINWHLNFILNSNSKRNYSTFRRLKLRHCTFLLFLNEHSISNCFTVASKICSLSSSEISGIPLRYFIKVGVNVDLSAGKSLVAFLTSTFIVAMANSETGDFDIMLNSRRYKKNNCGIIYEKSP